MRNTRPLLVQVVYDAREHLPLVQKDVVFPETDRDQHVTAAWDDNPRTHSPQQVAGLARKSLNGSVLQCR